MALKAPSKIGASTAHRPFQMALIVSAMSEKLMPRAASRSRRPSTKFDTVVFIFSHVPRMASRKPSLVFHRCTKAATRTAITATTARTGAETPPMAAPSFPKIPVPALAAALILLNAPASFTKPCMATPTLEMTVPMITRSGPMAATTRPMVMMAFFWLSSMPLSLSIKP